MARQIDRAREEERGVIARELHDEVGQIFTSLKLELARTTGVLLAERVSPASIDQIQALVGLVDVGAERVRRLATHLRPPVLDHLGLAAAIEFEAAALARQSGLRIRVKGAEVQTGLTGDQETAVFRIVQEALTNAIRHANASAVTVWLRRGARAFTLRVTDNGKGIVKAGRAGFGLLSMRERARDIGGDLSLAGRPGRGTTVTLTIPRAGR